MLFRSSLERVTAETQTQEHVEKQRALIGTRTYITNRYSMVVFRIVDDRGNDLSDYDLYFTAGPNFDENELPKGFFVDRQRNQRNPGKLTYYLDYDVMSEGLNKPRMEGKLGIRVQPRPAANDKALVFYQKLDFRSSLATVDKLLVPNETVMVEIMLQRQVDSSVFRMTNNLRPGPFDGTPSKKPVA